MWYIILFFATLILDQVSKILVEKLNPSITIIHGVLNINLSYNEGASFSWLADAEWAQTFFIILTSIVLIAGTAYMFVKKPQGKWLLSSIALLFSGTIGNFIDRIALGKVRDFIDVPFFANFNIADSCLCIGAFMLILYILFLDKEALFKRADGSIKKKSGDSSANNSDNGENK